MLKVKSNNKSNLTLLSVNEFQVNLSSNDKIRLASMKLQYNHNKQNYETDRNIVLDKLNIMQKDNKQVMKETDLNDSYITNSKSKFL